MWIAFSVPSRGPSVLVCASPSQASARASRPCMSRSATRVVCSAQAEGVNAKQAVAAAALACVVGLSAVEPAKADIAGLTPCAQSKAFQKREKNSIKKLVQRQKKASEPQTGQPLRGDPSRVGRSSPNGTGPGPVAGTNTKGIGSVVGSSPDGWTVSSRFLTWTEISGRVFR